MIPRIAAAIGAALPAWLPSPTNVTIQGTTTGTAGAGIVTGKLTVFNGAAAVVAALQQVGISGPSMQGFGTVIGSGVASSLNSTLQYSGTSPGVGSGNDVSKVVTANSATLISLLISNLQGQSVSGVEAPRLAQGLGIGIANLLQTGTGIGMVTGTASIISANSTSVSIAF